jgi:hypothetical protein
MVRVIIVKYQTFGRMADAYLEYRLDIAEGLNYLLGLGLLSLQSPKESITQFFQGDQQRLQHSPRS